MKDLKKIGFWRAFRLSDSTTSREDKIFGSSWNAQLALFAAREKFMIWAGVIAAALAVASFIPFSFLNFLSFIALLPLVVFVRFAVDLHTLWKDWDQTQWGAKRQRLGYTILAAIALGILINVF